MELLWLVGEDANEDIDAVAPVGWESLSPPSGIGFQELLYKGWLSQQKHSIGRLMQACS